MMTSITAAAHTVQSVASKRWENNCAAWWHDDLEQKCKLTHTNHNISEDEFWSPFSLSTTTRTTEIIPIVDRNDGRDVICCVCAAERLDYWHLKNEKRPLSVPYFSVSGEKTHPFSAISEFSRILKHVLTWGQRVFRGSFCARRVAARQLPIVAWVWNRLQPDLVDFNFKSPMHGVATSAVFHKKEGEITILYKTRTLLTSFHLYSLNWVFE